MFIKKYFYKITNKEKYYSYKVQHLEEKKIKIFKERVEEKIKNTQNSIKNKKEISFLHSGHLGDIVNSLPLINLKSSMVTYTYGKRPFLPPIDVLQSTARMVAGASIMNLTRLQWQPP